VRGRFEEKHPQVLLLASRYDLTCDYVVIQLRRRSIPYFRLNTEDLRNSIVELDPIQRRLVVECGAKRYCITPQCLRSVLFRRPVFLRDYGEDQHSPLERFSHIQWAAFVRNLMLFKEALWVNDLAATYKAEHKAVQLSVAASLGFAVPKTRVTNLPHPYLLGEKCKRMAIKGLDTVLLRAEGYEMFGFTTFESSEQLESDAWRSAPATVQVALTNKLDIRVTVIGNRVFAAAITVGGNPVSDDWRVHKRNAQFHEFDLPPETVGRCRALVRALGLVFGAIDLALCDGEYYFLEINPTGEWAWLVDSAGLPIDEAIADFLSQEVSLDEV
jgi:hypothetical protein